MTNEERAALVEWLRQEAKYEYSIVSPEKTNQTADQIEADGKRIKELEVELLEVDSEPSPYCPVCGSCGDEGCCGEKRCLYPDVALQERIAELEAEIDRLKGNDILYWEMSGGVRFPAGVAVRESTAPDGAANPVTVKVTMIGSRDD